MGARTVTLEYVGPKRGGVVVLSGGAALAFVPAEWAEREGIKHPGPFQYAVPEDLAEDLLKRTDGRGNPVFRRVEAPERTQKRGDD